MIFEPLYNIKRILTPAEGLEKVRQYMRGKVVCMGCRDYGSDYVYFVTAPGADPNIKQFVGGSPKVVNKRTGKVTEYEDSNLQRKKWMPVDMEK